MYHIAIVEDEAAFAAQLQEYLEKYQEEHDVRFKISVFGDGEEKGRPNIQETPP